MNKKGKTTVQALMEHSLPVESLQISVTHLQYEKTINKLSKINFSLHQLLSQLVNTFGRIYILIPMER